MKKFFTLLSVMIVGFTMLTSCSEDQLIGMSLEGTWAGDMYMQMEYSGNIYKVNESEICFSSDPFRTTKGSGYWIDYYQDGSEVANHIRWTVNNRTITIHFIEDGSTLILDDFEVNYNYFTGYIYEDDGTPVNFKLRKVGEADYRDWDSYYYGWNSYYGYSKGATRSADETSIDEKPIRHIVKE